MPYFSSLMCVNPSVNAGPSIRSTTGTLMNSSVVVSQKILCVNLNINYASVRRISQKWRKITLFVVSYTFFKLHVLISGARI